MNNHNAADYPSPYFIHPSSPSDRRPLSEWAYLVLKNAERGLPDSCSWDLLEEIQPESPGYSDQFNEGHKYMVLLHQIFDQTSRPDFIPDISIPYFYVGFQVGQCFVYDLSEGEDVDFRIIKVVEVADEDNFVAQYLAAYPV